MKLLEMLAVVVTVVALVTGQLCAQAAPKPSDPVKWSQPVDVESGWNVYSFWHEGDNGPLVTAADDWKCPNGLPVTDLHWWGSYIEGQPGGVTSFEISFHTNIPAGQELGHPSHPGALIRRVVVPVGEGGVQETFFSETPTHNIYQYNLKASSPEDYFPQVMGQIYWLNIIGISDNSTTWGWHTALRPGPDNGLDAAVNIYDYNPDSGQYTEWGSLYDGQGAVQLAFELTTVPEPASLALVGSAALVLMGLVYRRKMTN